MTILMENEDELGIMPTSEEEEQEEQEEQYDSSPPVTVEDSTQTNTVTLLTKRKGDSRRATQEEVDQWVALKKKAWSYGRIAKETGWTEDTVKRWVKPVLTSLGLNAYGRTIDDSPLPNYATDQETVRHQASMLQQQQVPVIEPEPLILPDPEEVKETKLNELRTEIIDFNLLPEDTQDKLLRLKDIMNDYQVNTKQIPKLLKAIGHSGAYQTYDGMWNFLSEWPGIGHRKAKLIVELLFAWTHEEQTRLHANQPHPQPQYPGQPQYPRQPQYPGQPQQPQYPNQQGQYPQQPQGLTKEDLQSTLDARDKEWQAKMDKRENEWEKKEVERKHREEKRDMEKRMDAITEKLNHRSTETTGQTIIRRNAILKPDGTPVIDPTTKQPMFNEEVVPISQVDPNAPMIAELAAIREDLKPNESASSDKVLALERDKMTATMDSKMKEIDANTKLAQAEFAKNIEITKLQTEAQKAKDAKLPAEAQIVSQTIEKQAEIGIQMLKNTNNNVKELVDLAKTMMLSGNNTSNKKKQKDVGWDEAEMAEVNEMMGE